MSDPASLVEAPEVVPLKTSASRWRWRPLAACYESGNDNFLLLRFVAATIAAKLEHAQAALYGGWLGRLRYFARRLLRLVR
jgi:hypothetical protein